MPIRLYDCAVCGGPIMTGEPFGMAKGPKVFHDRCRDGGEGMMSEAKGEIVSADDASAGEETKFNFNVARVGDGRASVKFHVEGYGDNPNTGATMSSQKQPRIRPEPQVGDFVEFIYGMPGPDYSEGVVLAREGEDLLVWDAWFNLEFWTKVATQLGYDSATGRVSMGTACKIEPSEFGKCDYQPDYPESHARYSHNVGEAYEYAKKSGRFEKRSRDTKGPKSKR